MVSNVPSDIGVILADDVPGLNAVGLEHLDCWDGIIVRFPDGGEVVVHSNPVAFHGLLPAGLP